MWKALGGNPVPIANIPPPPVGKSTHSVYALDYLRRNVLKPAGITKVSCSTTDDKTAALNYEKGATQSTECKLTHDHLL